MGVEAARLALRRGARGRARRPLVRHRHARLPRQDQRHRHPRRPAPARRRGRLRLRRRAALGGRARCADRAAAGTGTTLVVMADLRDGLPTRADESAGGDGAAAVLVGDDGPGAPVIAEYLGGASVTDEFLDRWRTPGDRRSKAWEERFGETRYVALGREAWEPALKAAGVDGRATSTRWWSPACTPGRPRRSAAQARRAATARWPTTWPPSVGQTGHGPSRPGAGRGARAGRARRGAWPWCPWPTAPTCSSSAPPTAVAGVVRRPSRWPTRSPAGADLPYGKFLSWRGMVTPEPPRRPEPAAGLGRRRPGAARTGSSASSARGTAPVGAVHLPPARVSMTGRRRRRHGAGRPWPTPGPPSSPTPSTAWPTRRARRSSSPCSTSTAAAGSRSS